MSKEKITKDKPVKILITDHYECPESRAHYCAFDNTKTGLCPVCGKKIIRVE